MRTGVPTVVVPGGDSSVTSYCLMEYAGLGADSHCILNDEAVHESIDAGGNSTEDSKQRDKQTSMLTLFLIVVHIIVETCITPVSAAISANGAVLQKTTSNTNSIKKRKKINSTECFFMDN